MTPTPHPYRRELDELLGSLAGLQGVATRRAIVRAVHDLFDSATAKPEPLGPPSDTNGSDPARVEHALFREPAAAELLIMQSSVPNGIEVNA